MECFRICKRKKEKEHQANNTGKKDSHYVTVDLPEQCTTGAKQQSPVNILERSTMCIAEQNNMGIAEHGRIGTSEQNTMSIAEQGTMGMPQQIIGITERKKVTDNKTIGMREETNKGMTGYRVITEGTDHPYDHLRRGRLSTDHEDRDKNDYDRVYVSMKNTSKGNEDASNSHELSNNSRALYQKENRNFSERKSACTQVEDGDSGGFHLDDNRRLIMRKSACTQVDDYDLPGFCDNDNEHFSKRKSAYTQVEDGDLEDTIKYRDYRYFNSRISICTQVEDCDFVASSTGQR